VSDSIGTLLATARAAKGVSLAEAATQLRCDEVLLRALEADRFEELGAPVFVQGHLRRYADYLGASTEQLMGAWATLRAEKLAEPDLARIPRAPVRAVDPKVWTGRAVAVGLTVLIAAAAWLILGWGSSSVPAPVAATPAPVAEPPPTAVPATTPVTTPTIAPAPAAPTPVAEAASEPESAPAPAPAPESAPAPAPAQIAALTPVSTGAAVLRLVPRQPSWIEVYDASNRRRYYGNAAAGTPLALRGEAPFSVVLGRADAVAIELDGRPITLPAAFVYNATAFVTIDAAGNVQRAAARNTRSTAP
jgi:cytoskeleton protein RodZ